MTTLISRFRDRPQGLGELTTTDLNSANSFLTAANSALSKAGATQSGGATQNDVGKAAQEVGLVAKTAGSIVATASGIVAAGSAAGATAGAVAAGTTLAEISPAFGPAAPAIIAVAAIVVGASILVDKIWGSSKPITPSINDYNDQLRDQITTIDNQTQKVVQALQTLGQVFKANGFSGLPTMPRSLNGSETVTPGLENELQQKVINLKALITTFNTSVNQTYALITGKSKGEKFILWGLFGFAAAMLAWFGIQEATDGLTGLKSKTSLKRTK